MSSGDRTVELPAVPPLTSDKAQLSVSANSLSPAQDAAVRQQMTASTADQTNLPAVSLGTAYMDYSSTDGPSVGVNLTPTENTVLNVAAGADAKAGLLLGKNSNLAIMQGSYTDGKWTIGALPSPMGVESYGTGNNFNDYSSIYNNVRSTALGLNYNVTDNFSVGITNDGTSPALAPNALELSYTGAKLGKKVTLNAAADIGLRNITLNANLTYKLNDKFSVSADVLQQNNQTYASVEGSYQLGHGLSVSAREDSRKGPALAVTETAPNGLFIRGEIEKGGPSVEAGIDIKV